MFQAGIVGLADTGGAYAVLAVGLVLLFRTTGVLNFAAAAVGTFGTFVMSVLNGHGWPYAPAALVGVGVGVLISVGFGLALTRWFFDSSSVHRAAVAVALLIGTVAVALRVFGDAPRVMPSIVNGSAFTVAHVHITYNAVVTMGVAIITTASITLVLSRSRVGLRLRAISQGPVACELLGLPVRSLSVGMWAVSGLLATVAMLLVTPTTLSEISELSYLVVPAMAAALVAAFRRYWLAAVAGFVLGAAQGVMSYSQTLSYYESIIPFAVIVGLLLYVERREVWDEAR
jgi:branched-chain amino acid transport system permease protein